MKTLNLRKGQRTKKSNRFLVDLISKIYLGYKQPGDGLLKQLKKKMTVRLD